MQSTQKLSFNPLDLAAGQEALFCRLVAECAAKHGVTYFEPGKSYSADVDFEITGGHPFLFRKKQSVPDQFRLDIVGKELGEGGQGSVYHIIVTLKPSDASRSDARRVVKIFENQSAANAEYQIGQSIPHLRMKPPISYVVEDEPLQAHVMRFFVGHELFEIKNTLNEDERLIVARNVLFAIKEQAHDLGVVHKDVKSENIIVDGCLRVNLIDYGFSHRHGVNNKKMVGTLAIMAPEVKLLQGSSIKSDVFSAGITLAELFGASDDEEESGLIQSPADLERKFADLFQCCPNMDERHRGCIKQLLLNMCKINPNQRCSLQDGIDLLEQIILERKQSTVRTRGQLLAYSKAHEAAKNTRRLLEQSDQRAGDRIEALKRRLASDMRELDDSPAVLEHYLFMLRVDKLMAAKNKTDANKIMESMLDQYHIGRMDFNACYAQYGQLLDTFPSSSGQIDAARQCYQDVTYFIKHKLPMYEKTIDGCVSLIQKLEKRHLLMKSHVEYLRAQIPQPAVAKPAR